MAVQKPLVSLLPWGRRATKASAHEPSAAPLLRSPSRTTLIRAQCFRSIHPRWYKGVGIHRKLKGGYRPCRRGRGRCTGLPWTINPTFRKKKQISATQIIFEMSKGRFSSVKYVSATCLMLLSRAQYDMLHHSGWIMAQVTNTRKQYCWVMVYSRPHLVIPRVHHNGYEPLLKVP